MRAVARGDRLRLVGRAAAAAFDALVPAACVGCRRGVAPDGPPLCALCRSRLPRLANPRCFRCAQPLGNLAAAAGEPVRCGTCEEWPDVLVAADAPFAFEGPVARTVRALKYDHWRALAPWMAGCMAPGAEAIASRIGEGAPWLVPVPLTPARLRERRFNQAGELARGLADRGVGSLGPFLDRLPGGGRQAGLRGALRRTNVQGRFRLRADPPDVCRSAIIIDDVLTTGATAIACAETLAEAGFRSVATVSFARTLRPLDGDESPTGAFAPNPSREESE
ncbi:ComF family protein [Candidatus Palauibacter soopunensis]|uniref:ComF family protein n=1 Tax=Candidatus Palauibacter soopunensis TaxID=3056739 RepID=UPI0023A09AE3|nr:ComF family protein [Candidatus Palauibacter soopunensis]MDE2880073.1 ComF family protein [Candidatus Palauibacter soopunensis]